MKGKNMFICEECGNQSGPREKQFRKIVATRLHNYGASIGTQIVKEHKVCGVCYKISTPIN